jgi:uncharacterized protein YndB with AHSA1/START domain
MIKKAKTMELTLQRTIPASAAEVYQAWLDAKNPGCPWSDAEHLIFNPEVDGMFYFRHVADNGEPLPHAGRFTELRHGRRIQYTWMSRHTQGLESVVTVTLRPKGRDTELTLNHANLPDNPLGRRHNQGWNYFLGVFGDRFADGKR